MEVLKRDEQVLIFVIGTAEGLKAKGLLTGGPADLAPAGRAEYERLKASGFRPTDEEIQAAMRFLCSPAATFD